MLASISMTAAADESQDSVDQVLIDEDAPLLMEAKPSDLPVVLTAARLKQPRTDVPAAVTVIPGDLILQLGVKSLHEVFRLVPGMTVGASGSNFPVLSYHGTKADEQRRLQILIDGRAQYAPNLASVDWLNLPVPLEEIERIEVTRGPNAASYGANSFLATVNIITRHPEDTAGSSARFFEGSNGYQRYYLHHGDITQGVHWRISGQGKKDSGFDRLANDTAFRDSYDLDGANLSVATSSYGPDQLSLQAGFLNGSHEIRLDPNDAEGGTAPNQEQTDAFGEFRWQHDINDSHFFHAQAYYQQRDRDQVWTGCAPELFFSPTLNQLTQRNPAYASAVFARLLGADPLAELTELYTAVQDGSAGLGSPEDDQVFQTLVGEILGGGSNLVCGEINNSIRERRWDLELQDTLRVTDRLRIVSGASLRHDRFESDTYFQGQGENVLGRLFFNAEYRPLDDWLINLGGMMEWDEDNGDYFSPRIALNYKLAENQALRLVLSHAIRTPDTFEQSAQWSYLAKNLSPPLPNDVTEARTFTTRSPGGLDNEKIVSREVGYYVNLPEYGLETDIKVFRDNLWNLIGGPLQLYTFAPENNLALTQTGGELETSWHPISQDRFRLTYAYLDQDEAYTGTQTYNRLATAITPERLFEIESRLNARHSGSGAWQHFFGRGLSTGLVYYYADNRSGNTFERGDLILNYTYHWRDYRISVMLKGEYLFENDPLIFRDYRMDDDHHVYAGLIVEF